MELRARTNRVTDTTTRDNKENIGTTRQSDETTITISNRAALGDITNDTVITAEAIRKYAEEEEATTCNSNEGENNSIAITVPSISFNYADSLTRFHRLPYKVPSKLTSRLSSIYAPHDVDSMDREDERSCWEYAKDITDYHLFLEDKRAPNPSYMLKQKDITGKMRCILIDWLVDVHVKYELLPQTLYLAINLLDRYLEKNLAISRQNLQLAGVAALFIASKYEEIYPPEAMDFVRITDNAYTLEQLFQMEQHMLITISYRVTVPTAYQFLQRWLKVTHSTRSQVACFAKYVMERTLQECKMLRYKASIIAAASIIVARTQCGEHPLWNETAEFHTGYSEVELKECVKDLYAILLNASNQIGKSSKLTAVQRKYAKERFGAVSTFALNIEENS